MTALRVVFMGTPDFAVPTLAGIADAGHELAAVYTQPPRPAGRGMAERRSPVHETADRMGLPVVTPKTLRDPDAQSAFAAHGADVAVVVAYGLILPTPVLDAPAHGCLNLHASLLPRWRGAAPIQRAVMAGDAETGVCVMRMAEGLDETPQPEAGVTYAAKIDKAEARIDWARPAGELHDHIRGLSPFPGAWFEGPDGRTRVKVLRAAPADGAGLPGAVLDDALTVACGSGALRLLEVQRQGKGVMAAAEMLRGYPLPAGTVLG